MVALGSVLGTIKDTIDEMREEDHRIGAVEMVPKALRSTVSVHTGGQVRTGFYSRTHTSNLTSIKQTHEGRVDSRGLLSKKPRY